MIIEKYEYRPLFLERTGYPQVYSGYHEWLVGAALRREMSGYLTLGLARYGTSMTLDRINNKLIEKGLETNATHFMFLDTDLIPKDGAFGRLMAHDVDIATGTYFSKDDFSKVIDPCIGFSIIKRDVFLKLERPWFKLTDTATEDVYFYRKALEAGFIVKRDQNEVAEHLGVFSNRDVKLKLNKEVISQL